VPGAERKELANGTTSVTWNNLAKTDINGNAYTFSVKEVTATGEDFNTPQTTPKTESGLTVTNIYQSPTDGTATATKTWVNGPATHPTVWFKLYRNIEGGQVEEVPVAEAPIQELANGTTSVTWNNLTTTDNNGNATSFTVKEVDANGNDFTPANYTKSGEGTLAITNTYVIPTDGEYTATKIWSGDAKVRARP